MDLFSLVIVLFLLAIVSSIVLRSNSWPGSGKKAKLPPGPYPFPVVGNIFQLTGPPHEALTTLSKTYGPLMSVHLGRLYTIVISSPEIARELIHKHDIVVSNRIIPAASEAHDLHKYSLAFLPVGKKWRDLRKICKEQMFSTIRLEAGRGLRQEKLQKMCDYVKKCSEIGRVVNIYEAVFITALNLISATLFSAELTSYDSDATQEFKEAIEDSVKNLGVTNFADYFPILKPFDPQGIKRRVEVSLGKLLATMEDQIKERLQTRISLSEKNDLLETLLELSQGSAYNLTLNDIKHLLLVSSSSPLTFNFYDLTSILDEDLFVAGAETLVTTVEWAMTELLSHPEILSKAKAELMSVIGEGNQPQESDISRLPYLQAVIKEALRYHPPFPFLIPHLTDADIQLCGYSIPKGTRIIINAFAMGRDPSLWMNPNAFEPERFVGKNIDFKGQFFELIPFGSGRRICPGIPLADLMVHTMVATLIHNIDWKLESGIKPEQVDMREKFGLTLRKLVPLKAIPIKP